MFGCHTRFIKLLDVFEAMFNIGLIIVLSRKCSRVEFIPELVVCLPLHTVFGLKSAIISKCLGECSSINKSVTNLNKVR